MKIFLRYHAPVIGWALIIFIQSSLPAVSLPEITIIGIDKVAHIGIYALLGLLAFRSLWYSHEKKLSAKDYFLVAIAVSLYGASDEIHQYFVPYRSCEFYDFVADSIGAILAAMAVYVYFRRRSIGAATTKT